MSSLLRRAAAAVALLSSHPAPPTSLAASTTAALRFHSSPSRLRRKPSAPPPPAEAERVSGGGGKSAEKPAAATPASPKSRPPKVTNATTGIVIRSMSFTNPFPPSSDQFGGHARRVGLPESRSLYTVLRSPHIDKKSREQFAMKVKRQLALIRVGSKEELRRKLFWLKRRRALGVQCEVRLYCKTRLDDPAIGRRTAKV